MLTFQALNRISIPFGSFLLFFLSSLVIFFFFFFYNLAHCTLLLVMYMSFSCWSVSSSGEGGVFLFINPDLQQALVRWMEKRIKFFPYADPKPLGKDHEAPFSSILCSWDRHETWVPVSRDDGPLGGRAPENQPCAHFGAIFSLAGWVVSPQETWEVTWGDGPHLTDIEHPCCFMTLYCVRPNQASIYFSLWPKKSWHTGQRGNWPSLNDLVLFPNSGQIRDECLGIHPSIHSASINQVLTIHHVLSCVLKTKQWVRKALILASWIIKHNGKDK